MAKNLPAVWETQVQCLGQEDPVKKGIATHPSILAWRIPWTEEPGGLWSVGSQRVGLTHTHTRAHTRLPSGHASQGHLFQAGSTRRQSDIRWPLAHLYPSATRRMSHLLSSRGGTCSCQGCCFLLLLEQPPPRLSVWSQVRGPAFRDQAVVQGSRGSQQAVRETLLTFYFAARSTWKPY